jgi:predicted peptidase
MMNYLKRINTAFLFASLLVLVVSCKEDNPSLDSPNSDPVNDALGSLPKDTGGAHIANLLGSTDAAFGYYIYLPGGYDESKANYPLMIFLHGKFERGDGTDKPEVLDRVLKNGPPKMIERQEWDPKYPMIVISPQYHGNTGNANNWGAGDASNLRNFIEYVMDKYRINKKRIYLTGLSHGGNGVYDYVSSVEDSISYIAAAAPVAAYGGARKGVTMARNTPIWIFVGDQDVTNMNTSRDFVTKYNEQDPAPVEQAKITIFNGVGHNAWTRTYNGDGIGTTDPNFTPFDMSLYDWMFQFERD